MAQAADHMKVDSAPSVADIIARNDDPLTLALRSGEDLSNTDLLLLNGALSSSSTSVGSSPTAVFSSHEPSIVTKPTSHGTDFPAYNHNDDSKVAIEYAWSLSASHGSDSEAEVEHHNAHQDTLLGAGAWSSDRQSHDGALRRRENTAIRLSEFLPSRCKKPRVVIHQSEGNRVPSLSATNLSSVTAPTGTKPGPQTEADLEAETKPNKCPRNHIPRHHYVAFGATCLTFSAIFLAGMLVGRRSR